MTPGLLFYIVGSAVGWFIGWLACDVVIRFQKRLRRNRLTTCDEATGTFDAMKLLFAEMEHTTDLETMTSQKRVFDRLCARHQELIALYLRNGR